MKLNLINQIIHLYTQPVRVAILMSGKGSNADVILENRDRYKNLNFVTICTDRSDSNALKLSQKYGLNHFCLEGKISTPEAREYYFQQLAAYLHEMKIDTLIYAGFMKITPAFFLKQFPGINVHPADLSILDQSGHPKYTGMNVIQDAIQGGETYLASTAHVVDCDVDCGLPILVSKRFSLENRDTTNIKALHEQLKIECEHQLYPLVLELLSQGRIFPRDLPYQWNDLIEKIEIKDEPYFCDKLTGQYDQATPLDLAYLAQDYSSQVNFDFENIEQVFGKVKEEFEELAQAFDGRKQNFEHFIEEIGDCFFALVNLCRFIPLHPDTVVKKNIIKYIKRCKYIEDQLLKENRSWTHASQSEIYAMWKNAKEFEKNS